MAPKFSMAPASKSGMRDEVEFLEREGNAEVVVVIVQGEFGDIEREGRETDLVRRGADAQLYAVLLAAGALEIADHEGDEIRGHFGRGLKSYRVFATGGPALASSLAIGAIRNRRVAIVDR